MPDYDDQEDHNFALAMAAEMQAQADADHEEAVAQHFEDLERQDG